MKMAAHAQLFTLLSLSLALFFSSLDFSTSEHLSSSLTIGSDQLNFWSRNVQNKMPDSILKKLSPMSTMDCNYYSNLMMSENEMFSADSNFCSMARLACDSALGDADGINKVARTFANSFRIGDLKHENHDPFFFFRLEKLKTGNLVRLPNLKESLPQRSFLPEKIASRIPLNMETISQIFPDITTSENAKEAIETSLYYCNAGEMKGEIMSCPKSLEELIGFAKSTLGSKKLIALASKSAEGSNSELRVGKVKKFDKVKKVVTCHEAFLPFAAYFCHSMASSHLYEVDLVDPKNGYPVNTMIALCHMDTSPWPKNHMAFETLKFGPGQGEACHWITQLDLSWISAMETDEAL